MRAAQFFAPHDIRIVTLPQPVPQPNDLLISLEWCGICGSDLHEYTHGPFVIPSSTPHPLTHETLPVTLGHEFCGRVKWAPEGSKFEVGDAVVADPRLYCRACVRCEGGETSNCGAWGFKGLTGGGGGFSEMIAVDERQVYGIPESLLPYASLVEPLAVAWHAVKRPGFTSYASKTVLVVGGGPIGVALLLVLRARGVERVFVSEPTVVRRRQCGELADGVFDPTDVRVGDECRKMTGGEGVDVVFDAAGSVPGLRDGLDALRYKGWYVNVALWGKEMAVPFLPFMDKELNMTSSKVYSDDEFRETVDEFAKGSFKGYEKMVTSRIRLEDIAEKGFEALVKHRDEHIKILVTPKDELLSAYT